MAKNFGVILKYIREIIIIILIIIIGVFIYAKINDNSTIDALNNAVNNYRTGFNLVIRGFGDIKKQLDIHARTIGEIEQRNNYLESALIESERLRRITRDEITGSLERTEKLEDINRAIEERIKDSLRILGNN
jgi:hypothetical protein